MNAARICVIGWLLGTSHVASADWPRFRGPRGMGVCEQGTPIPEEWDGPKSKNINWEFELPGRGVSSPIVVGNRVFVTCYIGYGEDREHVGNLNDLKRKLICLDRAGGDQVWEQVVETVPGEDPYTGSGVPEHGYASHTPVSDGEHVYVFFGKSGVLAYDMNGQELWRTSVGDGSDPRKWGSACSPILHPKLLIVTAAAESEAIIAFDKLTGKEVWRQEAAGLIGVWGTPTLVEVDRTGRSDLVIGVPHEIWGLNPETGELRWYCNAVRTSLFLSSVVQHKGVVYAVAGRGGAIAVEAGGEGDVSELDESKNEEGRESRVVWNESISGVGDVYRFATPVIHDGRLYAFAGGFVTCLDTETGKLLFQERLPPPGRDSQEGTGDEESEKSPPEDFASPVLCDGKIYYVRRSGHTYVLEAGDQFRVIAVNQTTDKPGEFFAATPAISNGELFIRSNTHLYCIAEK